MAQGKKSFLLYADYKPTIDKLSDDLAGKILKLIMDYVNDNDPDLSKEDILIQVVFEPIRQQLKRDLKTWKQKKKKRSEAGKKGGIKSAESRRSEALLHFASENEAIVELASENEANEAVNVNANVNVNVNATATIDRQKVLEYLRGAAPIGTERSALEAEADLLMKTYSGKKIGNLRALCNKWMANFAERPTMPQPPKKMVL